MRFNNYEIKKLFDFILINKNIVLSDYSLFSRDTLIMLRDIIKGKRINDFELSKEQEDILVESFIKGNFIFDDDTPSFILSNRECINATLERNLESANYIINFTPELEKKILDLAVKNKYILKENSPFFLKRNCGIALNSIRQDVSSANYVDWDAMSKKYSNKLINETIKAGYILSVNSCYALKENPDIVLSSISKDAETICYAGIEVKDNPKIFKYLVLNNYDFEIKDLKKQTLSSYTNTDIMKYAFCKCGFLDKEDSYFANLFKDFSNDDIDKYIERYSSLFATAINTIPTISSFKGVFQFVASIEWEYYRNQNLDELANIFGKISVELQSTNDFRDAVSNLRLLRRMKKVLGDKYNLLIQAMEQYHAIIHSKLKLDNIDFARDQIAKLSALYVSMVKEKFKKEKLAEYEIFLYDYYIPRKDHPVVCKKIIDCKRKKAIEKLYRKKDKAIYDFLDIVVEQYACDVDKELLWEMIDNFVVVGYSKMNSFIKAPRGFNDYKRYEEACKLINRLNSKYIKYTDLELDLYLDIVKYDNNTDKYYYEGPTFDNEQVDKYHEYRKKQKIFDKIKQQIIFKARTLKIDETITREEMLKIDRDLPFNDEYYEFDEVYFSKKFTFGNFINNCIVEYDVIAPMSFLDDETYNVLHNYVISNGLIWILLFSKENNILEDYFDRKSFFDTLDSMVEIVRLSKKFNYDINKYEDIFLLEELSQCADDESIAILGKEIVDKLCKNQLYTYNNTETILSIAKELICQMVKKNKFTVPHIEGSTTNYDYSLYDSQDEELLLSGINTDACFKIDGIDNDFFHYCALNKNGFVIKITNRLGNFIGRAAGFRNGNCIFINQLRTIYDHSGDCCFCEDVKEKAEIIDTFRKACNDIVETSQNNKDEKHKIDFVFVTKSYAMGAVKSNVSKSVENKIGDRPMVSDSDDWKDFVRDTDNLRNCSIDRGFSVDYGNYSLICVASSKETSFFNKIKPRDIKLKDVEAVYTRKRNSIIVADKIDDNILNKINRINGINSYLLDIDFEYVSIPSDAMVFVGDNWYIIYLNGNIIDSLVLEFDKKAQLEYRATRQVLEEYNMTNEHFDIDKLSEQYKVSNQDSYEKLKCKKRSLFNF